MQNAAIWILKNIMANTNILTMPRQSTSEKKERKKIRMKHLLLLWRFVIRTKYDFNSKLHKPFCTKAPANACMICVSFCNKVRNNFTTVERKTSSRVTWRSGVLGHESFRWRSNYTRAWTRKQFKLFLLLLKEHENTNFVLLPKNERKTFLLWNVMIITHVRSRTASEAIASAFVDSHVVESIALFQQNA